MPFEGLEQKRRQGDRRMLVIFAVVVFAFTVQSFRLETQNHTIAATNRRISATQHRDCLARNDSARRFNRVLDTIIGTVRSTPGLTQAERDRRVDIYTNAKARVVNCAVTADG
jgi:hypothetical protein